MALPNYKDILDLVKAGLTLEAQEKIMELRQAALDYQEENLKLRSRILELEARIKEMEEPAGERCPRCGKRTWFVEKSFRDGRFGILGGIRRTYKCKECQFRESILVTPGESTNQAVGTRKKGN
jgi:transposase-like protein